MSPADDQSGLAREAIQAVDWFTRLPVRHSDDTRGTHLLLLAAWSLAGKAQEADAREPAAADPVIGRAIFSDRESGHCAVSSGDGLEAPFQGNWVPRCLTLVRDSPRRRFVCGLWII